MSTLFLIMAGVRQDPLTSQLTTGQWKKSTCGRSMNQELISYRSKQITGRNSYTKLGIRLHTSLSNILPLFPFRQNPLVSLEQAILCKLTETCFDGQRTYVSLPVSPPFPSKHSSFMTTSYILHPY